MVAFFCACMMRGGWAPENVHRVFCYYMRCESLAAQYGSCIVLTGGDVVGVLDQNVVEADPRQGVFPGRAVIVNVKLEVFLGHFHAAAIHTHMMDSDRRGMGFLVAGAGSQGSRSETS